VKQPLVSVCIPVKNSELYISDAVLSIINQSYENIEIIIIDNNSDDNTYLILKSLQLKYNNIKLFRNKTDIGFVNNFNLTLSKSSGKYIKFLCSDDIIHNDLISAMVNYLEINKKTSLISTKRKFFNHSSEINYHKKKKYKVKEVDGKKMISKCLSQRNYIGEPSAVMFRKILAKRYFLTTFKQLVDLEFWFYLLEKGNFAYISQALCFIRKHKNQMTEINKHSDIILKENIDLCEIYFEKKYFSLGFLNSRISKVYFAYKFFANNKNATYRTKKRYISFFKLSFFSLWLGKLIYFIRSYN
jgi:glycosyltransferase involved in cell wall biosynthesis